MDSALAVHRLHFAFTVTFHYLFPQLTMGLALLIVWMKTMALWKNDEHYNNSARFWAKIFAINFAVGVVTGIPMEFQFGTNWARFAKAGGGVLGQTLAMEGVYSFFLESSFLGLFIYGEKLLGRRLHWFSSVLVWVGSWLSGFFIVATDAWMQHPTGYAVGADGSIRLDSFWGLMLNPWTLWQYPHTMLGAVATGSFVMASVGAFYLIAKRQEEYGRTFVRMGVIAALGAAVLLLASGDRQGHNVATYQPVTLAATEGLFETAQGAPVTILGQPDTNALRIDNPLLVPRVLSFITYRNWSAEVKGLNDYPRDLWPDNVPLLYYSFHIMVGLGTIFIALAGICVVWLWLGRLYESKTLLWALMLALPFPYIANTAGWMTAELGRQPWLVYGMMRTAAGDSNNVSAGNALFTLVGFMGVYTVLGILFLFLVYRELERGPSAVVTEGH
ncbi:MAG TPA: cytochrome ubiquinol oxidase subunit I [Bryobacteraceae bacterium]|jgi:cytochrome d ubiquinol oxidase subunit I